MKIDFYIESNELPWTKGLSPLFGPVYRFSNYFHHSLWPLWSWRLFIKSKNLFYKFLLYMNFSKFLFTFFARVKKVSKESTPREKSFSTRIIQNVSNPGNLLNPVNPGSDNKKVIILSCIILKWVSCYSQKFMN